jgi:hypothetical protein
MPRTLVPPRGCDRPSAGAGRKIERKNRSVADRVHP